MARRTKPDANQPEIIEALENNGFVVFDMSGVPYATKDKNLDGLPDLMAIDPDGLTLIGKFDPRQVIGALEACRVQNVQIISGAVILPEVKTPKGRLRESQLKWWRNIGLEPLVFQVARQVYEFCGRMIE